MLNLLKSKVFKSNAIGPPVHFQNIYNRPRDDKFSTWHHKMKQLSVVTTNSLFTTLDNVVRQKQAHQTLTLTMTECTYPLITNMLDTNL